jgi:hypothetical protein
MLLAQADLIIFYYSVSTFITKHPEITPFLVSMLHPAPQEHTDVPLYTTALPQQPSHATGNGRGHVELNDEQRICSLSACSQSQ